jgi:hypothetical protein
MLYIPDSWEDDDELVVIKPTKAPVLVKHKPFFSLVESLGSWQERQTISLQLSRMHYNKKMSLGHRIDKILIRTSQLSDQSKTHQKKLLIHAELPNELKKIILRFWSVNIIDHELMTTVSSMFTMFSLKFSSLDNVVLKGCRIID